MTFIAIRCRHCQSEQCVKGGKTARGTQRYVCQNTLWTKGSVLLDACHRGCVPAGKHTSIDRRLHASGVRETARSLPICPTTVLRALKQTATALASVQTSFLRTLHPAEVALHMERGGAASVAARVGPRRGGLGHGARRCSRGGEGCDVVVRREPRPPPLALACH